MKKTITLLTIILLVVFMVGCENTINPTQPISQNDNAGVSLAKQSVPSTPEVNASKGGKDKVEICHLTGNGKYVLISVATSALPAHMAHGDRVPALGNWTVINTKGSHHLYYFDDWSGVHVNSDEPIEVTKNTVSCEDGNVSFEVEFWVAGKYYRIVYTSTTVSEDFMEGTRMIYRSQSLPVNIPDDFYRDGSWTAVPL